jgi:hypothetical protein
LRYDDSTEFYLPRDARYNKLLKKRKIEGARMLETPLLNSPASLDFSIVDEVQEIWGVGTKLWKLAANHYGDGTLYWVIALYNGKPTDAHWAIGDIIYIPFPYEYVVEALGY